MSIINRFFSLGLLMLFACVAAVPAHAVTVKNIRGGVNPDKIRLVLELDQVVDFKVALFDAPPRLVVELPNVDIDDHAVLELAKLGISDVRQEDGRGIDRLTFGLRSPVKVLSSFMLPRDGAKPDRLVIDYKRVEQSEFKAATAQTLGTISDSKSFAPRSGLLGTLTYKGNRTAPLATGKTPAAARQTNNEDQVPFPSASAARADSDNDADDVPLDPGRKYVVVIDAGHGGKDPGAIGVGHVQEKNITLAAAKELAAQLQKTGRYQAILTRGNDRFILLPDRVRFARGARADLFVSLHADMAGSGNQVNGLSIYTLSDKASDEQTEKLAARENKVDLLSGVDLSHQEQDVANILIDLAMRENMNQSRFFAGKVINAMMSSDIELLERPQRYAGFAVLKAADIPSVLIEMGFLSNPSEARRLQDEAYRRRLMQGVERGIDAYFDHLEKNQRL